MALVYSTYVPTTTIIIYTINDATYARSFITLVQYGKCSKWGLLGIFIIEDD